MSDEKNDVKILKGNTGSGAPNAGAKKNFAGGIQPPRIPERSSGATPQRGSKDLSPPAPSKVYELGDLEDIGKTDSSADSDFGFVPKKSTFVPTRPKVKVILLDPSKVYLGKPVGSDDSGSPFAEPNPEPKKEQVKKESVVNKEPGIEKKPVVGKTPVSEKASVVKKEPVKMASVKALANYPKVKPVRLDPALIYPQSKVGQEAPFAEPRSDKADQAIEKKETSSHPHAQSASPLVKPDRLSAKDPSLKQNSGKGNDNMPKAGSNAEPMPRAESLPKPMTDLKSKVAPLTTPKPEAGPKVAPLTTPKTEAKPKVEPMTKPKTDLKPKVEPLTKPKTEPTPNSASGSPQSKIEKTPQSEKMEVLGPDQDSKQDRSLTKSNEQGKTISKWAFWRRASQRDEQLARISDGYLEMVDLVRAIRSQLESQNENNIILRDSLAHLPEAMEGLTSFSKSQHTVGQALQEIHGQMKQYSSKDEKLVDSMKGFNTTLKGMDDTSKATMRTFDRVQERMRDSDIRMENLVKNVQSTEEKVSDTMMRLQQNMARMQTIFLACLLLAIVALILTLFVKKDEEKAPAVPAPIVVQTSAPEPLPVVPQESRNGVVPDSEEEGE
jgi:hypothetical protein